MNPSVTIVGASVAGLFAAYHLARQGTPVRVYEAQPTFDPAPRTLIVTPAWLRLLDFDVEEAILNRTHSFELISQGASTRIPLREPDVILERARFMRLLARKVEQAGGSLVLGHRLKQLQNHRAVPSLHFDSQERERQILAPRVLGADGVHSTVAEGVERDGLERVAILQARVPLPTDLSPDTVRVWFDRSSTRFFYWLIPESSQTAAAGLIADTPEQARRALDRFLTAHDLAAMEYQAAWVPLHNLSFNHRASASDGRVLLVGDAVGQVKVTTVGGVVTGMRGAVAAARSLARGTSYAAELRPFQRELNFHALVRHMLDGFTDEDYDQLLELLNHRGKRVLSHYNRDQLTHAAWRLLPAQPRWLLMGARAMVRGFQRLNAT